MVLLKTKVVKVGTDDFLLPFIGSGTSSWVLSLCFIPDCNARGKILKERAKEGDGEGKSSSYFCFVFLIFNFSAGVDSIGRYCWR